MVDDFQIEVGADVKSAVSSLEFLRTVLREVKGDINSFDRNLGKGAAGQQVGMRRTLKTYEQLGRTIKSVTTNLAGLEAVNQLSETSTKSYTRALGMLGAALKTVEAISEAEFAGKTRTLALYTQLNAMSNKYALGKHAEAKASSVATAEEARAVAAKEASAAASDRATIAAIKRAAAEQKAASAANSQPSFISGGGGTTPTDSSRGNGSGEGAVVLWNNANADVAARMAGEVSRASSALDVYNVRMRESRVRMDETLFAQDRFNEALGRFEKNAFANQFALTRLGILYGSIAAAAGATALAVTAAGASFEQAFAELKVSVGVSEIGKDFESLEQSLIDLSARVPSTVEELSKIASSGAQMGVPTEDLDQFTKTIAMFVTQSDVAAEEAAKLFGRISNLADVPLSNLENFASMVAKLGRDSAATEGEILKVTQSIAATATESGFSEDHIVGLSTALASLGVPPEWARGALQRVFAQVNRAADEGAAGMEKYATVMGVTGQAALELKNSDPTAFYLQLIQGIDKATASGQSFTAVMDELGIKNTRDVQLMQRLASNHDLVAQSIGSATEEYSKGTYLQDNFNVIVDTTINTLKRLWNQIVAFAASAGQTFLPIVQDIAEAMIKMLQAFGWAADIIAPLAPVLGLIIAPLFAIKAAAALASASMATFAGLGRSGLNTYTKQKDALSNLAGAFTASAGAQRAHQNIMKQGVSNLQQTGRLLFYTADAQEAVAKRANTLVNAMTPMQQRFSAIQGAAAGAGRAVGGFLTSTGMGATAAIGGTIALITALINRFSDLQDTLSGVDAAETAASDLERYNDALMGSAGGSEALQAAIAADTAAFKDAGYAANEANGVYTTMQKTYQDLGNGAYHVNEVVTDLADGTDRVAGSYTTYGAQLDEANTMTRELAYGIGITSKYIDEETVALGKNVDAWKDKAMQDFIAGLSDEDMNKMKDAGVNISEMMALGIEGGSAAVNAAMASEIAKVEKQLEEAKFDLQFIEGSQGPGGLMADLLGLDTGVDSAKAEVDRLQNILNTLQMPGNLFEGWDNSIENAQTKAGILRDMVDEAAQAGIDLDGLNIFANFIDPEAVTTASDLASALQDVYNEAFKIVDIQGAIYEALEGLGAAIVDNGGSFDVVTEEGRANMEALKDVVASYAAEMGQMIEEGMNPADAAAQMQANVQAIIDQLSNMGVDTSQLDWLMDYVNQFVSDPKTITIDANGNPAINTANDLLSGINSGVGIVVVDADTNPAIAKLNQLSAIVNSLLSGIGAVVGATNRASSGFGTMARGPIQSRGSSSARIPTPSRSTIPTAPSMNTGAQRAALQKQQQAAQGAEKANRDNGNAAKKAQDAARKATEQQNRELEQQKQYVNDLASYYKNLGNEIFAGVDAEAGTFKALQELGLAIQENGVHFNTFSEGGRANFSALSDAMSSFGDILSLQVERGVLDANGAMAQFRQYASGLYTELVNLGVPAAQVAGFFGSLGASASGWNSNIQGVQQFAYVLTDANAAAKGVGSAIQSLSAELKKAKEWADILGDSLDDVFMSMFGKQSARDDALSAIYDLRDGYQDALDTLRDLREENQKLNADLGTANADKNKAEIEAGISAKYGETDRQQEYLAQAGEAQARIDEIQIDLGINADSIRSMEQYMGVVEGTSKEAIANRKALTDLQKAMIGSIQAYAAAGASTEELNDYTAQLRKEFVDTATQSGYSASAIAHYATAFDGYVNVVKSTPKTVLTTAIANTDPAKAALNTIPRFGNHLTTAQADTSQAVWAVNAIPQWGNYAVYSYAEPSSYGATAGGLGALAGGRNAPMYPYVDSGGYNYASSLLAGLGRFRTVTYGVQVVGGFGAFAGRAQGGMITKGLAGFASGGKIPGKPPRNPNFDNLLAKVDNKGFVAVRSGEFIQSEPAVDHYGESFMNAVNNRTLPKDIARYANGGMPASNGYGGGSSSGGGGGVTMVELSPADRALLTELREVQAVLVTSDRMIAETANRGNKQLTRRGSSGE